MQYPFYKVVCEATNESLPEIFDTFTEAYTAFRKWNKEFSVITENYEAGSYGLDYTIVYDSQWEDREESLISDSPNPCCVDKVCADYTPFIYKIIKKIFIGG